MSSAGTESILNGPRSLQAHDFCPVIGPSSKYENLIYNFGMTDALFDKDAADEEKLKIYIKGTELASKIVLDQIGIEKFSPNEKES